MGKVPDFSLGRGGSVNVERGENISSAFLYEREIFVRISAAVSVTWNVR